MTAAPSSDRPVATPATRERGEFFAGTRLLGAEDRIELHTVGVDVGSATTPRSRW